MEQKKKEEAYREKPENLKDVYEFDKKNMKEDPVNKNLGKDAQEKLKKRDDDLLERFDAFGEGFE